MTRPVENGSTRVVLTERDWRFELRHELGKLLTVWEAARAAEDILDQLRPELPTPQVVYRAARWREVVRRELVQRGIQGDEADQEAVRVLRRILGRCRWPEQAYRLAVSQLASERTPL